MEVKRIDVLGVPVDVCSLSALEEKVLEMLESNEPKRIMFISVWDLLKARGKNEYSECLRSADLILPVSKSILKGAKFLKKDIPVRHNQFKSLIRILSLLESRSKSFYIFGGRNKSLNQAFRNIKSTFSGLSIVGRHVGYYKKDVEEDIIQAISKASPSLVLLSDGIKEKDCWAYSRRSQLPSSIFLYYRDSVGIFSKRVKRVGEKTFDRGLEIWSEILKNPLKLFLIFPYIGYIMCLIWYRLFRSK